jgi:saccharopine dehydrogenase (NAD+, L-lysine forming)
MSKLIGIRREDKNQWEKRVPLIPEHVKQLKEEYDIETMIQPSPIRVFKENDYRRAGAVVSEDLSACDVVFAVKEIPVDFFEKNKTYVFFSHTIKGQDYNMPMLKHMMKNGCNLIDYEKIVDSNGRRLVFFGRFAGLAGMIDTLWALGRRLKWEKKDSVFSDIKKTVDYHDLSSIKQHLVKIGKKIEKKGVCKSLTPLIFGFAGYGNVSKGAQEVLDLLPVEEIRPSQIESVFDNPSNKVVYKVVFKEEDMVEPKKRYFELQDYYKHPEKYKPAFHRYVPFLTVLMNCVYWDDRYPRLISKDFVKTNFKNDFRLKVVGDISIDINGAVEFTEKSTTPDMPVFVYDPLTDTFEDGFTSDGIVVMAVDNLPCELPRDSSRAFSESLWRFVPEIVKTDYNKNFEDIKLPSEIKNALILHKGKLTPDYEYINKFL